MFGPVRATPYDLVFSIFGIPVRVLPWFWLLAAFLGFDYLKDPDRGMALILIWAGVVFVSILVHELGHALTAMLFGYQPRILLYQFGGLAMYEPYRDYTTGKAILITLAGPGAGFLLFGVSLAVWIGFELAGTHPAPLIKDALTMLLSVNLVWTLFNLLPVLPLDGGKVCSEICMALNPQRGMIWALWVSLVLAALCALGLFKLRMMFGGIMMLWLAGGNYQELQQRRSW